jgi:NADH-quinone oxidoreductase subunit A
VYFDYTNVFIFLAFGAAFVVLNVSILSRFLRPKVKDAAKETTYECGEPAIGSGWVRFDIRFYTVALIFLIFDVEVAFLYPWAVLFQEARRAPGPDLAEWQAPFFLFAEMLVFLGILLVGFVYVWARGDLSWIKTTDKNQILPAGSPGSEVPSEREVIGG